MQLKKTFIHVDQHVLGFHEKDADYNGIWENEDEAFGSERGIGTRKDAMAVWAVDISRAAGTIPVFVEVRDKKPGDEDIEEYDGVMEASLYTESGELVVSNENDEMPLVEVDSGHYRLRLYYAGSSTARCDCSDGAEHLRVVLYPVDGILPTEVIKTRCNKSDDPSFEYTGKRSQEEMVQWLSSENESHQCLAAIALMKAGAFDVVKKAAKKSAILEDVMISTLFYTGAEGIADLKEYLQDEKEERVLQALGTLDVMFAMVDRTDLKGSMLVEAFQSRVLELAEHENDEIADLAQTILDG